MAFTEEQLDVIRETANEHGTAHMIQQNGPNGGKMKAGDDRRYAWATTEHAKGAQDYMTRTMAAHQGLPTEHSQLQQLSGRLMSHNGNTTSGQ